MLRGTSFASLCVLIGTFGLGACGDDGAADPGAGDMAAPDMALADAHMDAAAAPGCGDALPETVVVLPEPTPVPLAGAWWRGWVAGGTDDPAFGDFVSGTLSVDGPGTDARGIDWARAEVGETFGALSSPGTTLYFLRDLPVANGERLFARAGRGVTLASPGATQQGDVYDDGHHRVALPGATPEGTAESGTLPLAVRINPPRGRPAVQLDLWSTTAELVVDTISPHRPDLRVGERIDAWVGSRVTNLRGEALSPVLARVVESDLFEASETAHPSIGAGATAQLAFALEAKRAITAEDLAGETPTLPVTLEVTSPCLSAAYRTTVDLTVRARDEVFSVTRRSPVDGSVQYHAVRPPAEETPGTDYGLLLTLHGAAVRAPGQARAFGPSPDAYIVAPTNRHRFGFDWEAWGRIDALEALDHAMDTLPIDARRVYLSGHSMGGHGTWNIGVLFPERFALVGPSAGWRSFYSYPRDPVPGEPFLSASRGSDTERYAGNLTRRAVYILHGDADDNVPVTEARAMRELLAPAVPTLGYHEEPGAGHWWDRDPDRPGADCVDWAPMWTMMSERRVADVELDFDFRTPSPSVSATHAYVRVRSAATPLEDVVIESRADGAAVTLTTTNVRSLVLDGDALTRAGVATLAVDGEAVSVRSGAIPVGPQEGKRDDQYGPLAQAFEQPFCFVHGDADRVAAGYAAYWSGYWATLGNGYACTVPESLESTLDASVGRIWLRPSPREGLPFRWTEAGVDTPEGGPAAASVAFVWPRGEALDVYVITPADAGDALFVFPPFSYRPRLPDYMAWSDEGVFAAGFFDGEWERAETLSFGAL
ncbi:MAG: prolyl oligopeptidase family serine peptidase [Myxococcota bacterium]